MNNMRHASEMAAIDDRGNDRRIMSVREDMLKIIVVNPEMMRSEIAEGNSLFVSPTPQLTPNAVRTDASGNRLLFGARPVTGVDVFRDEPHSSIGRCDINATEMPTAGGEDARRCASGRTGRPIRGENRVEIPIV